MKFSLTSQSLRALIPATNRATFLSLYERDSSPDDHKYLPNWLQPSRGWTWQLLLQEDRTTLSNPLRAKHRDDAYDLVQQLELLAEPSHPPGHDVLRWLTLVLELRRLSRISSPDVGDWLRIWNAYSDPLLLPAVVRKSLENKVNPPVPRVELHAHFRGSIPAAWLWEKCLSDDRTASLLRKIPCTGEVFDFCPEPHQGSQVTITLADVLLRARWHAGVLSNAGGGMCFGRTSRICSYLWRQIEKQLHPRCNSAPQRTTYAQVRELYSPSRIADGGALSFNLIRSLCCYHTARGIFYRQLLCQREETGLVRFSDHYNRYSDVSKLGRSGVGSTRLRRDQTRHICDHFMKGQGRGEADSVGAILELRPTVDRTSTEIRRNIQAHVLGWLDHLANDGGKSALTFGLVFSFCKQDTFGSDRVHYWETQADHLIEVLESTPSLRPFVVGIDFCGRERGTSPKAFASVICKFANYHDKHGLSRYLATDNRLPTHSIKDLVARHVVKADQNGCRWMVSDGIFNEILTVMSARQCRPRLGLTVHVGEDFVVPLTGLRAVYEAVYSLDMTDGDRLGHALVLGVTNYCKWMNSRCKRSISLVTFFEKKTNQEGPPYRVQQPRGERLADLFWDAMFCERLHGDGEDETCRRLLLEARDVASRCLGLPTPPDRLHDLYLRAGDHFSIPVEGYRFKDLTSDSADLECFDVQFADLCRWESYREALLEVVIRRGLVIESCPTSNMLVGGLDSMEDLPIVTFLKKNDLCTVVATDDPGVFGSTLQGEFALIERIRDTKVERIPDIAMEQLARAAERASFIKAAPTTAR